MSSRRSTGALRHLRELLRSGTVAGLTDAQLLRRYAESAGEADAAFAALVDRHGPMVWGVCRRMLTDPRDAEDAFQAVFLILARRAGGVRVDDSLGRWLHGVARKVAARARADALRRRAAEGLADPPTPRDDPAAYAHAAELRLAVGEELDRLPEAYRSPIELCHLEGLTYDQAAARLGWPTATLKGRLLRARALLRARLERRGWGPPLAVPAELARRVAEARPTAPALTLAKGVLRTMTLYRLAQAAALLILTATGARLVAAHGFAPDPPPPPAAVEKPATYSTAISVPLPDSTTLHALLRRAAAEADAVARKSPDTFSWTLSTLADAQASSGDIDGARETFAHALDEATGAYGKQAYAWNVWRIGHSQVKAGLKVDAKQSMMKCLDLAPATDAGKDAKRDIETSRTYAMVVRDLARIGERDAAQQALDRYRIFASSAEAKSKISNLKEVIAIELAPATAAAGDFKDAFKTAAEHHGSAPLLGEMAAAAAESCEPEKAREFIEETERRLRKWMYSFALQVVEAPERGKRERYDVNYRASTLQLIAQAKSRLGDQEGARRTAMSIEWDATSSPLAAYAGRPGAMFLVATPQIEAGNFASGRETLRTAFQLLIWAKDAYAYKETFNTIASAQIVAGDAAGALATLRAAPGGPNPNLAAQVGLLQSVSGETDAAKATMKLAFDAAPLFREEERNPGFSAGIETVGLHARAGDVTTALRSAKSLESESHRRWALKIIASARAAAGDVAGALRIADDETKSPADRRAALEGLGEGVLLRLKLEAALKVGK